LTQTLAVNQRNDLYIGLDGNLAQAFGLQAVLQAAQQAAKTRLGEMIYATDQGLPFFEAVWVGVPNLSQYSAYLRRTLLAVADVTDVSELTLSRSDNLLTYRAVIRTTYGTGAING
jgi:hypothetical protein